MGATASSFVFPTTLNRSRLELSGRRFRENNVDVFSRVNERGERDGGDDGVSLCCVAGDGGLVVDNRSEAPKTVEADELDATEALGKTPDELECKEFAVLLFIFAKCAAPL